MSKQTLIFVLIGILMMYYLYNLRNQFKEGFSQLPDNNYIQNGGFLDGKPITNSEGLTLGNTIIKMDNPSESPYVLKQTSVTKNKTSNNFYTINVNLEPGKKYRLSLWENLSSKYDGKQNLFQVIVKMKDNVDTILTSKGNIILSETVMNNDWYRKEYIFSLPQNANGSVKIQIGEGSMNKAGNRFFTDVQLENYYQVLKLFPIKKGLMTFISMFNIDNVDDLNIIKDLTGNGNNFGSEQTIKINGKAIDLNNTSLKGPPSDSLGINNKFSIGFSLSGITSPRTEILKMFSNNVFKYGLEIIINKQNISDNYITVKFKNNVYNWKLGLIENYNNYCLTHVDNAFRFYMNGILINPEIEKINKDLPKENETSNENINTGGSDTDTFFINSPCYINMDKQGKGFLYAFYVFNYELSFGDINKVNGYLNLEYYKNRNKSTFNEMVKDVRKVSNKPIIIHKYGETEIDMSKYILKDEIPCWGCNLE